MSRVHRRASLIVAPASAALLALVGCGDSGGNHDADGRREAGAEAVPAAPDAGVDASRNDLGNTVEVFALDRPLPDVAVTFDGAEPDRPLDDAAALDLAAESTTGEAAPLFIDPCAPAALIPLALAGPGSLTVAGAVRGGSTLKPQTLGCGAGPTGPEVVYALALPAGEFHMVASTVGAGTTADTLVYAQTACGAGTELACNDDVGAPGPSLVSTPVVGPATIYLVVDTMTPEPAPGTRDYSLTITLAAPIAGGGACAAVKPGQTDPCGAGFVCPPAAGAAATCALDTAPVLDTIEIFPQLGQPATEIMVYLSAHDPDGDWQALTLAFKDAGAGLLDTQTQSLNDYWGQAVLGETALSLSVPPGTVAADATVTDSRALTSATVHAVANGWASLGEVCDARLTRPDPCLGDLVCAGGNCAVSGAAATACAQALPLPLDSPASGTAADLSADTFEGTCHYDRGGHDRVYRATLPALTGNAVAWDLIASTANPSVPFDYLLHLDTYVYIRASCADPSSELGCSDDVADADFRSEAIATNLAPGDYYVFLDTSSADQNGSAVSYTLVARVRPVLPAGSACDPAGAVNRCQLGACTALTSHCP